MEWRDFGRLMKALREEAHIVYPRGMTQMDLAQAIMSHPQIQAHSLSLDAVLNTIRSIEQGAFSCLNERKISVLLAIADTLRLTRLERIYLLSMANGIPHTEMYASRIDQAQVLQQLKMRLMRIRTPAFVTDSIGNILLANRYMIALLGGERLLALRSRMQKELARASRRNALQYVSVIPNVLFFIFSSDVGFFDMLQKYKDEVLISNVQFFRRTSLPYRAKERWKRLVEWLSRQCPDRQCRERFRVYWTKAAIREDLDGNTHRIYHMRLFHLPGAPRVTHLALASEEPVEGGSLVLVSYIPLDAKTWEVFTNLHTATSSLPEIADLTSYVSILFPSHSKRS